MNSPDIIALFTDGSVNPQTRVGYGAYLFAKDTGVSLEELRRDVKIVRFAGTSSTKLELQCLVFALAAHPYNSRTKFVVYTDSQNIVELPGRRARLEGKGFRNRFGELLSNQKLYEEFYRLMDSMHVEIVKIKGHVGDADKKLLDRIFSLVDKGAREACRE